MPHYPAMFTINRLDCMARLGVGAPERAVPQPIAIALAIHFPQLPPACASDKASVIDYAALSAALCALATGREYRLIEYMAQQLFTAARDYVDAHGGSNAALTLTLTKCKPDVPYLTQGAGFTVSDLPAGATVAAAISCGAQA